LIESDKAKSVVLVTTDFLNSNLNKTFVLKKGFNMNKSVLNMLVSLSLLSLNVANANAETTSITKPVTEQIVDTLTKLSSGPHAGFRANHAKGIVVDGEFLAAPTAAAITKASYLQDTTLTPVIVRFSNATGVPNIPDADGNAFPKGMAIRFNLPDDAVTDIVVISVNSFPAANPEDFLGLLNAVAETKPDSPKPSPIEQFLGTHPAAKKFVTTPKPAPVSFATQAFFGVNAFKFTNQKGQINYGRYIIKPLAGDQHLSQEAAAKEAPNYLMDELPVRLKTSSVQYSIALQVAEEGDVIDNATVSWPTTRKVIELGTLTLKTMHADGVKFEKTTMYNPLNLVEGIEPSNDPILLARPAAYAVSFGRRIGK
jgi:catalase